MSRNLRIYVNLHKSTSNHLVYSLQEKKNNTWKVIDYIYKPIIIYNVKSKVYQGNWKKIKEQYNREGKFTRNVHAFLEFSFKSKCPENYHLLNKIRYNIMEGKFSIDEADKLYVSPHGIYQIKEIT